MNGALPRLEHNSYNKSMIYHPNRTPKAEFGALIVTLLRALLAVVIL